MRVLIIRHGCATQYDFGAQAKLSLRGKVQTTLLRKKLPFKPELFVHSGFLRSKETAEILNLKINAPIIEDSSMKEIHTDKEYSKFKGKEALEQLIKYGGLNDTLVVSHHGLLLAIASTLSSNPPKHFNNLEGLNLTIEDGKITKSSFWPAKKRGR